MQLSYFNVLFLSFFFRLRMSSSSPNVVRAEEGNDQPVAQPMTRKEKDKIGRKSQEKASITLSNGRIYPDGSTSQEFQRIDMV